jgi:TPR repeat protein
MVFAALVMLRCGVSPADAPCAQSSLGIEAAGVKISRVLPGGPAEIAGLQEGDVLLQIGDERIEYACEVERLAVNRECTPVRVVIERDGATVEKTLAPAQQADAAPAPESTENACNAGNGAACATLASQSPDATRALELYTRACNLGHARGCYSMGISYDTGRGTVTNNARAAYGYEQACDAGVSMACTDLGFLLERGRGVMADRKRAAELFRRGCEGSPCEPPNLRGCVNLGDAYRDGIGVEQDYARAAQIFRATCDSPIRAEEEARVRACVLFAALQFDGEGVPEDEEAALRTSKDGCEQGDAFGCFNVAAILASREEYELAADFYRRSCEGDDAEACYQLGLLHEEGNGAPFDFARAGELFRKACRAGFAKACEK